MAVPLAAFSLRIRARIPNKPGSFAALATVIGEAGGSLVGIEITGTDGATVTRDLVVFCGSEGHAAAVEAATRSVASVEILAVEDRTFAVHERGKLSVEAKLPLRDRDDLAMAYTPGVARVCLSIADQPALVHRYTMKSNTVAVVTDGTAVLGLGNIGPEAALPVMEGKAVLFKTFAGVDAVPVCLKVSSADELVETVQRMEPMFGGINLEDIAAPHCFEVEARLTEALAIPVFHDDQHGTAVVVLAALRNACKLVGKELAQLRIVLSGAGAAGVAITKILLRGADVFIGVSGPDLLDRADLETMAAGPIVFALANPVPEVSPEEAEGVVAVMATGRSDYPNQINNVLCFPGIFRGALDAGATRITESMKLAAADAIAAAVSPGDLKADEIVPSVFAPGVADRVAAAVAAAARADGVTR
jgi:malate dehydrogenase (oxaloacetate-decarboxylating)